jgi:hypothetical protein
MTPLHAAAEIARAGIGQVTSTTIIVTLVTVITGAALYGLWSGMIRLDDWLLARRKHRARTSTVPVQIVPYPDDAVSRADRWHTEGIEEEIDAMMKDYGNG